MILTGAGALLGGCSASEESDSGIVTEEQVAQRLAAAAPNLPRPGQYAIAILENGQPPASAPDGLVRGCLSKEQLADPLQALVTGGRSDCAFGSFNFKGPRLEAAMMCASDAGPQSMWLNAHYRPDGYDLDMTVGSGEDERRISMKARLLGPCAESEDDTDNQQGSKP
ncbi:DUF3617 domain-containing protein [Sphingomicrobium flavum]|uniref:DUF3617 domain-containing protein n=1 Tax=Sphingomicrobium flavum TaxID=1229164 RepID=UPI0021AD6E80|nr:DUF3617 domain-containing protein [Sphingomicrobium flavum]